MFRYIFAWRDLGRIRRPCYLYIPHRALLGTFLGIAAQMWLWCLLPTPFMLYTLPFGLIVLWQLWAWLHLWRSFLYVSLPPATIFALFTLLSLLTRSTTHRLLYRIYVWMRYLPYGA
jgi:hypothetical protein